MTSRQVFAGAHVLGAAELVREGDGWFPHRFPAPARAQLPDDVARACAEQGAGVRIALRTAARRLEVDVRARRVLSVNRPPSGGRGRVPGPGRWDAVVDGEVVATGFAAEHGLVELDFRARRGLWTPAPVTTVVLDGLPAGEKDVEVWLPYGEATHLVALRADAAIAPPTTAPRPRWVHHGSSISQGSAAASTTSSWPALVARRLGLDLANVALAGNAVLDPFVARAIRYRPAHLVTLKLGINVVNLDAFRLRTFRPAVEGFLDTVREGHPDVPLVVVSPLLCPVVEGVPGPTEIDPATADSDVPVFRTVGRVEELASGKLSLRQVREVLAEVVERRRAAGDGALAYLDGLELFGAAEWARMPMPDGLHPDDAGHRHVADRFGAALPGFAPGLAPTRPRA